MRRCTATHLAAAFLMGLAGCNSEPVRVVDAPNAPAEAEEPEEPVWSDGPGNGAVQTSRGETFRLETTRCDFYSVVATICDAFELTAEIRPGELAEREITVSLTGRTVEEVMASLAAKAGLRCDEAREAVWNVTLPGHEADSPVIVRMSDY